MAYSNINKPNQYFEATIYAGGTTAITSLDFSPDLVWAKKRTGIENHGIFDSVRGVYQSINSNTTAAETTRSGALTSFDSNGWSMGGADGIISAPGNDYVGWAWRGSDSSAVSNTDGSITSTVSANTTSGFSIVSYTGTGSVATVGHGLGSAPYMIILKSRTNGSSLWRVGHQSLAWTNEIFLNDTAGTNASSGAWNNTAPTSSVFTLGTGGYGNASGENFIAYCFVPKKGFSAMGQYTGNGSTDGTFVYTGFKPAYLLIKRSDSVSQWRVWDNKRNTYNVTDTVLLPNDSGADVTNSNQYVDLLSNGFKWRASYVDTNASGGTYIYMAFAENPLVAGNYVPTTAR